MDRVATGFGLLEAPVWVEGKGLLFADAEKGGVFCLDGRGNVSPVVEHRRGIGGMVRHENGGLVVSGRNVAFKGEARAPTLVLLDRNPSHDIVGFNDITTDPSGRIYAGALGFLPTESELSGIGGEGPTAPLFLIDLDGSVRVVQRGIKLTNGLGFSPDARTLYHADSGNRVVYAYHVREKGELSKGRPFAAIEQGLPDGIAVASDGSVWIAVAHGGRVLIFEPDGSLRSRIDFPLPMITSLCFGGPDLRDVYVVSGSEGTGRDDCGTIFRARSDVPGTVVYPARVQLPVSP